MKVYIYFNDNTFITIALPDKDAQELFSLLSTKGFKALGTSWVLEGVKVVINWENVKYISLDKPYENKNWF